MTSPQTSSEALNLLRNVNFYQLGLIIAGTWLLISLGSRFLAWIADRVSGRFRFYILSSIPPLRLLIITISLPLIITSVIGSSMENLLVLLGLLGLGIGFAFKEYISSLVAGVVTLYEAPYRPGDWVEINGAYGEVKSINMRCAKLVTPDDTVVIIPHLKVWDQLIYNANDGGQNLQCAADFYLHPRHDASQVRDMLTDVALTSVFLQLQQSISVIVTEKPWATLYRLKAYPIEPRQQFNFITDLTIRGKEVLTKAGVEYAASPAITAGG